MSLKHQIGMQAQTLWGEQAAPEPYQPTVPVTGFELQCIELEIESALGALKASMSADQFENDRRVLALRERREWVAQQLQAVT